MAGLAGIVAALEKIANRIGALPYGTFDGTIDEMIARGDIIEYTDGVYRSADGKVAYLYIGSANNINKELEERNTVHIYKCPILSGMQNAGRAADRYIGTTDATNIGMFRLETGKLAKLPVCGHCYKRVRPRGMYGTKNSFNYADFAKDRYITPQVDYRKGHTESKYTRF